MKGVQCYELFGGKALKNHALFFLFFAPEHLGVPQSTDLGPMPLSKYTEPLSAIIVSHSIMHHSFADD